MSISLSFLSPNPRIKCGHYAGGTSGIQDKALTASWLRFHTATRWSRARTKQRLQPQPHYLPKLPCVSFRERDSASGLRNPFLLFLDPGSHLSGSVTSGMMWPWRLASSEKQASTPAMNDFSNASYRPCSLYSLYARKKGGTATASTM